MTFTPTSSYKMSKEIKRLLVTMNNDPEFKQWYKHKIIQADLEHEFKQKHKNKEQKESNPE